MIKAALIIALLVLPAQSVTAFSPEQPSAAAATLAPADDVAAKTKIARDIVIAITGVSDPAQAFDQYTPATVAQMAEGMFKTRGLNVDDKKYPGLKDKLMTAFAVPLRKNLVDGYPGLYNDMIGIWVSELNEADLLRSSQFFNSAFMRKTRKLRDINEAAFAKNPNSVSSTISPQDVPALSNDDVQELEQIVRNDAAFVERFGQAVTKMEGLKAGWLNQKIEEVTGSIDVQFKQILRTYGL